MDRDKLADDGFMYRARREPSQAFATRLRGQLRQMETARRPQPLHGPLARWMAAAASIALVSVVFAFPSVRAGAAALFDFFRVKNFAAVAYDPERLREMSTSIEVDFDFLRLPGPPTSYAQLPEAGAAAGIRARVPAWIPSGWSQKSVMVTGEYAFRLNAGTMKFRRLLGELGIGDVAVPEVEDQQVSVQRLGVRVAPLVQTSYEDAAGRRVSLTQGPIPDVQFPADLDLAALAEIFLRMLGLERNEAYRFAQSIDWRTTFLVPVPANEGTFRQVDVQGNAGLLVETTVGGSSEPRPENSLLWSDGEQVYVLRGALRGRDLLDMAQSMQ